MRFGDENLDERFWDKLHVDLSTGCWLWSAYLDKGGYGRLRTRGRTYLAHRVAYEGLIGKIPEGLVIDHLCRVRNCVNPAHLEPVTQGENTRRGESGKCWADKTHCTKGHPYEGKNLYVCPKGRRYCRECMRVAGRAYRAKRRAS